MKKREKKKERQKQTDRQTDNYIQPTLTKIKRKNETR